MWSITLTQVLRICGASCLMATTRAALALISPKHGPVPKLPLLRLGHHVVQRLSEHLEDSQQKAEDLQQRAEDAEERLLATPASQMHREVNPLFSGSQDSPGDSQREASELEEALQHRAELEAMLGTQQQELQVLQSWCTPPGKLATDLTGRVHGDMTMCLPNFQPTAPDCSHSQPGKAPGQRRLCCVLTSAHTWLAWQRPGLAPADP